MSQTSDKGLIKLATRNRCFEVKAQTDQSDLHFPKHAGSSLPTATKEKNCQQLFVVM